MPRGDGSGPQGQGSMTGRGMGQCGKGKRQTESVSSPIRRSTETPGRGKGASGMERGAPGGGLGQRIPRRRGTQ